MNMNILNSFSSKNFGNAANFNNTVQIKTESMIESFFDLILSKK